MGSIRHLGLWPNRRCAPPLSPILSLEEVDLLLPLSTAMAAIWRVKQWSLSWNATWQEADGGPTISRSGSVDTPSWQTVYSGPFYEGEPNVGDILTTESQLVCQRFNSWGALYGETGIAPIGAGFFARSRFDVDSNGNVVKADDQSGPIRLNWIFSASTTRWSITPNGGGANVGNLKFKILEEEYDIPLLGVNSLGSVGSFSGDFVYEASEYWPYDPNDGNGPIYDSDTGNQIRPFP